MEELALFRNFIRQKGIRQTIPREQILEVFLEIEEHVSAQELFEEVHKHYPSIGSATVYRAVKLFVEADLANEVVLGDGTIRYEHSYKHEHHDHLICLKCNRLVEVHNDNIEKIQASIAEEHGFLLKSHVMNLYGICPDCQ